MGSQVILEDTGSNPERVLGLAPMLGAAGKGAVQLPRWRPASARAPPAGGAGGVPRAGCPAGAARRHQACPASGRRSGRSEWCIPTSARARTSSPTSSTSRSSICAGTSPSRGNLFSHDASDLLEQVLVPALVVAAERDLFAPADAPERWRREFPSGAAGAARGSHAALVEPAGAGGADAGEVAGPDRGGSYFCR